MKKIIFFILFSLASITAYATSAIPVVYYSDLTSGPGTGGQNNEGVFVTIWGNNFGASQGSSTITVGGGAVYGYETWTNNMICFQLGSSAVTGTVIVTTSAGSSTGTMTSQLNSSTFTVRSGNIYFVNPVAGSNGTGTFASPFNHLYYAYQVVVAGDTVYVETGTIYNQIEGYINWHTLFMPTTTGTSADPVSWVAYPNDTITLQADGGIATWTDGSSGGTDNVDYIFRGNGPDWQTFSKFNLSFNGTFPFTFTVSSANATTGAVYSSNGNDFTVTSTISGGTTLLANSSGVPSGNGGSSGTLTKVSGTGDSTISYSSWYTLPGLADVADSNSQNGWKFVGNTSTALTYEYCQFCVSGANGMALGNTVQNSGAGVTNGNELHSIYVEAGADPFEVGWNNMINNENTGWEISNYHNGPRIGTTHDNYIVAASSGSVKGILVDGCGDTPSPDTLSTMETNNVKAYNNVIVGAGQHEAGGAMQANCGTNYIYNNTIYGSGTETDGVIQFEAGGIGPGGGNAVEYVANNIIVANNAGLYLSDATGNAPYSDQTFTLISNNNYFGEGNGPSQDTSPINADPKFTTNGSNFQLQSNSPDLAPAGYNTSATVPTDYNGITSSSSMWVGAYSGQTSSGGGGSNSGDTYIDISIKGITFK